MSSLKLLASREVQWCKPRKKEGPSWSNTKGICNLWKMAKVTRKACHVPAEIAHTHIVKHLLGTFACGQTSSIIKLLSFSWQGSFKTRKCRREKMEGISASSGDAFQPAWMAWMVLHPPWMLQHIPLLPLTGHFLLFRSVPCKIIFTSETIWGTLNSPCLPAPKFPRI